MKASTRWCDLLVVMNSQGQARICPRMVKKKKKVIEKVLVASLCRIDRIWLQRMGAK